MHVHMHLFIKRNRFRSVIHRTQKIAILCAYAIQMNTTYRYMRATCAREAVIHGGCFPSTVVNRYCIINQRDAVSVRGLSIRRRNTRYTRSFDRYIKHPLFDSFDLSMAGLLNRFSSPSCRAL